MMSDRSSEWIYICPRCFEAQDSDGHCSKDGTKLISCRPGHPDDPCRRPLVDEDGKIRTRAPIWWLRYSVMEVLRNYGDIPDKD